MNTMVRIKQAGRNPRYVALEDFQRELAVHDVEAANWIELLRADDDTTMGRTVLDAEGHRLLVTRCDSLLMEIADVLWPDGKVCDTDRDGLELLEIITDTMQRAGFAPAAK